MLIENDPYKGGAGPMSIQLSFSLAEADPTKPGLGYKLQ